MWVEKAYSGLSFQLHFASMNKKHFEQFFDTTVRLAKSSFSINSFHMRISFMHKKLRVFAWNLLS